MEEFKIIAKTFQGLEEVLAKELKALGANNIETGRRMVSFTGNQEMLYRANFCLRTAVKVLKPIKEFKAQDADDVYEVVKKMDWSQYMDVTTTFLIETVVFSEQLRHSRFVAYRVKDAIADYWREKTGERPNVGITNPDLRINVHVSDEEVSISLDSSGESLHLRGYKVKNTEAPINEVLAAGLVLLSGWDCQCDLIDPFCGSGTILIEAALIAQNIYPGVFRKEYAFERWKDFDEELFDRIYNDDSEERAFDYKIYGYDINRRVVQIALENVKSAGVQNIVDVQQGDIANFEQPVEKSIIITNPPYGERIKAEGTDDILKLYSTIGERLKHAFVGGDAWIICNKEEYFASIGMRPSTRIALLNGNIECEFRKYQIFDGKLKERREEGLDIKSDEDRRRNVKFKPYRKNEDGEWSRGERSMDTEEHYFRSKPYKEEKRAWQTERSNRREEKQRPLSAYNQHKQIFEAMDEEEREIIDRHLGKWGDRTTPIAREENQRGRSRRDDKKNRGGKRDDWGFARLENQDTEPERPSRGDRRYEDRPRRNPFPGKKGGKK
ncbi:MAG: RNA methyltransferase [Bacteroidaceae bacterium]|nr:RNA methyltransferase [Bacteroidaceae bacterium]